jgi:Xaa-Pro dipeptidase
MPIAASEYRERAERARALMREQKLDALMVTGDYLFSNNYRYLTGHLPRDYQSTTDRTNVLVLTLDGAAICAHPSGQAGAKATWVDEVVTYTPPFSSAALKSVFELLGITSGRIGAELANDQRLMMPVAEYEALKASLPDTTWVDGGALLWSLRMVKSKAEVEMIRAGDKVNLAALREVYANSRPGMTQLELRGLIARSLVTAGSIRPPHSQINMESTSKTRGAEGFVLAPGDLVFIDTGVVQDGYWAEFNRMATVGAPTATQERWHARARSINEKWWTRILRPGITAEDAILLHIGEMEAAGLDAAQSGREKLMNPPYPHHAHGIGLSTSEPPRFRLGEKTVLKAGMVINVETYIWDGATRYACEEDVLVTETGAEPLSEPDTGLFVIG